MRTFKRRGRLVGLALATLLAVPGSWEEVRAAQPSGPPVDAEALSRDAAEYAATFNVSSDEAATRLRAQPELNRIASELSDAAPARFAGAWIEHQPTYRLVVSFAGGDGGLPSLDALGINAPAEVVISGGATFSLAELTSALGRIAPVLDRDLPDTASEVDVKAGQLLLTSPRQISDVELATVQSLAGVPVRVETGPPVRPLHTYGGRMVKDNIGICTTGFTVRSTSTGVRGVTTAGHCGNSSIDYYQNGTTHYPMTYRGQAYDDDQDVQWMSESSHVVYPQFWDGTSFRTVWATESVSQMLGDVVCHYGEKTGYSCGTIVSTTFDPGDICGPTGNNPCYSSWIKVTGSNLACYEGDSGGPFFASNTAYGILSAGLSSGTARGQCSVAVFMQTQYIVMMGLEILTGYTG